MTTTLNHKDIDGVVILNTSISMTTKMNNVDNHEQQQRVFLQRGGLILNTTISISHGKQRRQTETAMSKTNKRRSKMTTSNDQQRDLGRGKYKNTTISLSPLVVSWTLSAVQSFDVNVNDNFKRRRHRPRLEGQFKNTTINISPLVMSSAGSQRTMTTTSNNDVQRQGGNFKYNNLHDNKDEQRRHQ